VTVLVVAPHPDDECLGCGGTLAALADDGGVVLAVFLTSGELGLPGMDAAEARTVREREAEAAAAVLGLARTVFLREPDWGLADRLDPVTKSIVALVEQEGVEQVYVPHALDEHPDHAAAFCAVRRAVHAIGDPAPAVHTYEVWSPLPRWSRAEDVTAVMPRKLEALREHRSQLGYYDYATAVEGLNRYRGALTTRTGYAEVFGEIGDG
jgi:LmbE family N-acetylglucosaminyl deacetylase